MKSLDVVALLQDIPERSLMRGQVGTILEELDSDSVLVEFADLNGVAHTVSPLSIELLLGLKHSAPAGVAKGLVKAPEPMTPSSEKSMSIKYDDQDDILVIEFSDEPVVRDISYGWSLNVGYTANGIAQIVILDAKAAGYWPPKDFPPLCPTIS